MQEYPVVVTSMILRATGPVNIIQWSIFTSGLLSEVSEHGGERPAADIVRLGLTGLVTTDGGELSNGLKTIQSTVRRAGRWEVGGLLQSGALKVRDSDEGSWC